MIKKQNMQSSQNEKQNLANNLFIGKRRNRHKFPLISIWFIYEKRKLRPHLHMKRCKNFKFLTATRNFYFTKHF